MKSALLNYFANAFVILIIKKKILHLSRKEINVITIIISTIFIFFDCYNYFFLIHGKSLNEYTGNGLFN